MPRRMHADEVETDASLVRRLLASQFPQWADLPIEVVESAGTSNAMYRLGGDMAVRLPRQASAVGQVEREHEWLPVLAPQLPLAIPEPIEVGAPAEGFPWTWAVYRWLDGTTPAVESLAASRDAAVALGEFVAALQRIDATGGPPPGAENSRRGVPLATRDEATRKAIASLDGEFDTEAVIAAWEAALDAPVWDAPPRWLHGDLLTTNLLVDDGGQLSAVIDFGCLGVGDPACDAIPAWSVFSAPAREAFRAASRMDDASWARGRGWALSIALIQLPYYRETNPTLVASARRTIAEVLADRSSDAKIFR